MRLLVFCTLLLGNICGAALQENKCVKGFFPLHETIKNEFKCKVKRPRRDLTGSCIRMCSFQTRAGETFNYTNLQEEWCSHMIILSADLLNVGGVKISDIVKENIYAFNKWKIPSKPLLILSIGDSQSKDVWRAAIGMANRRMVTLRSINQLVKEYDLDGVDISWTESSPESIIDSNNIASFLAELRTLLPHKQLIVSVTPQFTYNAHFNGEAVSKSVDYFLLQGYKFHSYNKLFTGHHSPLFASSEVLSNPKMSIEGLSHDWVSRGVPAKKLIIGLSAEGMGMFLQNFRSESYMGAPANTHKVGSNGSVSQTEICQMIRGNNTEARYSEELGVPYLMKGDRYVAYDNERSIKTKAIFASLNNFGGLNLHGIDMDNIYGECPEGRPFPLVQALVKAQVCDYCGNKALLERPKKSECVPDFQIACSYIVQIAHFDIKPEEIPYDICTEIRINEASLFPNGEIFFWPFNHSDALDAVVTLASQNGNRSVVAQLKCHVSEDEFRNMLETRSILIDKILSFLAEYKLNGIEFRCDHLITPQNRDPFNLFLQDLKKKITESTTETCPPSVSLRIPVRNSELSETYNIDTLNSLDRIVLETFQTSMEEIELVSPLFSTQKDNQLDIDTVLHSWLAQGIRRESLLLDLPAYGIVQTIIQSPVDSEPRRNINPILFSQSDICAKLTAKRVRTKVLYDSVASYSVTSNQEFISYETQSTLTYKMKYAIREGLAGIGLATINNDDYTNVCKQGAFPLLKAIARNLCPVS